MQDPRDYKGEEEFYSRQGKLDVKRPIWRRYLWPLIACIALLLVVVFASTTIYLLANHAPDTTVVTLPQIVTATPMVPTQIPPTLVPTPTSAPTPTPTPAPITITENLQIPCAACSSPFGLELQRIDITLNDNISAFHFKVTNIGSRAQYVIFDLLSLQDDNGNTYNAEGGKNIPELGPGNSVIAILTFPFALKRGVKYIMKVTLGGFNIYKDQSISVSY